MFLRVRDDKLGIEYNLTFNNVDDMLSFFGEFNTLRFNVLNAEVFYDEKGELLK